MEDNEGDFALLAGQPTRDPITHAEATGTVHGVALCLSGGGYRAMIFHLGVIWRLNESGMLAKLKRISSVSGGSISAAVLALNWGKLVFKRDVATNLEELVIDPVRRLATQTIDIPSIVTGILSPLRSISEKLIATLDEQLFQGKTLADFPSDNDGPRFILNATNVQTGSLWRFSRPYMGDYQIGLWKSPRVPVALAAAASAAFPPVLSPCILEINLPPDVQGSTSVTSIPPFTQRVVLADGGVYDNLGLETAFKRYQMLLVSDAGMKISPETRPHEDWIMHTLRILELVDNQVRSLRKRQLISAFKLPRGNSGWRAGTYFSIRTNLSAFECGDPFGYGLKSRPRWQDTSMLAAIPTRLAALDKWQQEALINWGYAICDAAIRSRELPNHISEYTKCDVKVGVGLPFELSI